MDLSPVFHACAAVTAQCVCGLIFGDWVSGGVLGCLWFVAREQTQAEYRWIAQFGDGHRANMPWWGGLRSDPGMFRACWICWFPLLPAL